jgi:hypothetical protein
MKEEWKLPSQNIQQFSPYTLTKTYVMKEEYCSNENETRFGLL